MDPAPAPPTEPDLAEEFAAAMAWWDIAGVDQHFADDVTDWLARPTLEKPAQTARKKRKLAEPAMRSPAERLQAKNMQPLIDVAGDALPTELAAFQDWWMSEPSLAPGDPAMRTRPRGVAGAPLMVLVPEPEAGDQGELLSGPDGRLLSAMLRAMRIETGDVYYASALPAPIPLADFGVMADAGLAKVAQRHVALASPQRLLIFGAGILPLFGHDMAQEAASLRQITHDNGTVPAMAARTLANMRNLPGDRARFWRRWLQWTDN